MQTSARAGEQHTGRRGADAQPLPNLLGGHLLEAGQAENLSLPARQLAYGGS